MCDKSPKTSSVTSKKSPNVYKSCPKLFHYKNVGDLDKIIVTKCFEKLPKVQ